MHHRVSNFHSGWKAVENESPNFGFENGDQVSKLPQVLLCPVQRGRKVSLE